MKDPKIYLSLDNCFAIKRWVEPRTWLPLCKQLGYDFIEASFDNEMDFLYSPDWYIDAWFEELRQQEERHDVRVASFFTGYQTYRTAGLGHPDARMAEHLLEEWMFKAVKRLGARKTAMGFSFHALTDEVLQNRSLYRKTNDMIYDRMARLGMFAQENGDIPICVEAMYAPHQPPWTIKGTFEFLKECCIRGSRNIYTTVDLGHMIGQIRFLRPTFEQVEQSLRDARPDDRRPKFWIGSMETETIWRKAVQERETSRSAAERVYESIQEYSYFFANGVEDTCPYAWLEQLAAYSPIIHMQQTNGVTASHAAFTPSSNEKGIIEGERVLRAIATSYRAVDDSNLPPKADELYLSFEIFASNTEYRFDILDKLEKTAHYWRQFIPRDGMRLSELIARLDQQK